MQDSDSHARKGAPKKVEALAGPLFLGRLVG